MVRLDSKLKYLGWFHFRKLDLVWFYFRERNFVWFLFPGTLFGLVRFPETTSIWFNLCFGN